MSNELTTLRPGGTALPAAFANARPAAAFQNQNIESGAEGIEGGYPILKYAGKVFSLQQQGVARPFIRKDDGTARGSVDVIVVRSATHKAKTYYENFKEGSKDKPICFSNDGVRPDPSVQTPPSRNCAACPKNVFGSKITDEGKQAKACGDHKRTAVVVDPALALETFGAPIDEPALLRIPAASLTDFALYAQQMEHQNFPLPSIVTRVTFDITKNYPKLKFEAIRPLTDDEGVVAMALRDGPTAIRIVSDSVAEGDEPEPTGVTGNGNGGDPAKQLTTQVAPGVNGNGQQGQPVLTGHVPNPGPGSDPNAKPATETQTNGAGNVVQMTRQTPQQQAEAMQPDVDTAAQGNGATSFDADLDAEIAKLKS